MRSFDRRFDLDRLEGELQNNQWVRDLLALWAPAGVPALFDTTAKASARTPCLRLTVHDRDLDMYRLGQRLASIKFGSKHGLRSMIHHKYVTDGVDCQDHAYLNHEGLHLRGGKQRAYRGREDLIAWLERAELHKQGKEKEKKFVDEICGANANVIDLEMGLPAVANAEKKVAPRMDLVTLEPTDESGWRIVFWEAKMADNPELHQPLDENKKGNILSQVRTYTTWLDYEGNKDLIVSAYWQTCKILVGLHRIANQSGLQIAALGDGIKAVAAANKPPEVDPKPRVIIDHRGAKTSSLAANGYLDRLRDARIQVQVVHDRSGFVLGTKA